MARILRTAVNQQLKTLGSPRESEPITVGIITGMAIRTRSTMIQQKTNRPVPFELTEPTRDAITNWMHVRAARNGDWLFPNRSNADGHLTTRQYARLVDDWITMIGLNPSNYGTHSLRRNKVAMVYKRTGNLRAFQLLLGHNKLESTVRYLEIVADDALALSEQTEI
jgi:site-specific recombinase XerD